MHRRFLYLILSLMLTTGAGAQDCGAIISHGMRNVEISQSSEAATSLKYYNHCEKNLDEYSSAQLAQAEVEIFGSGQGSGGFSSQSRRLAIHDWCETNRAEASSHRQTYQEAKNIYQGAVSAWSACNELAAKSLYIDPVISPDGRTVNIGIAYRGPGTNGIELYAIEPENFVCTSKFPSRGGEQVKYPLFVGAQAVQVSCKRSAPMDRSIAGTLYEVLPRGTISVQTADSPFQLFFPEEFTPPAPMAEVARLQAALDGLVAQTEVVRAENAVLKQRLDGLAQRPDLVSYEFDFTINATGCETTGLGPGTVKCTVPLPPGALPTSPIRNAMLGMHLPPGAGDAETIVSLLDVDASRVIFYVSQPWRTSIAGGTKLTLRLSALATVARP